MESMSVIRICTIKKKFSGKNDQIKPISNFGTQYANMISNNIFNLDN